MANLNKDYQYNDGSTTESYYYSLRNDANIQNISLGMNLLNSMGYFFEIRAMQILTLSKEVKISGNASMSESDIDDMNNLIFTFAGGYQW